MEQNELDKINRNLYSEAKIFWIPNKTYSSQLLERLLSIGYSQVLLTLIYQIRRAVQLDKLCKKVMKTQKTITSPIDGKQIPVTKDLNVQPLMLMGKPVTNGRGESVMNDRWIYVNMPGYGHCAINVWRAHYCEKMYLSEVSIHESIGSNKLMDADLKKFVDQVSDKLVFERYGKWYRVYLRKLTARTFGIQKVVPYNWTVNPNMKVGGLFAHECCIDWKSKFFIR